VLAKCRGSKYSFGLFLPNNNLGYFLISTSYEKPFNTICRWNSILQDMRVNFACSDIHHSLLLADISSWEGLYAYRSFPSRFFKFGKEHMPVDPSLTDDFWIHRSFLTIAPSSSRIPSNLMIYMFLARKFLSSQLILPDLARFEKALWPSGLRR
jgi:hypothetical protein